LQALQVQHLHASKAPTASHTQPLDRQWWRRVTSAAYNVCTSSLTDEITAMVSACGASVRGQAPPPEAFTGSHDRRTT
jgi:hypothetical protein